MNNRISIKQAVALSGLSENYIRKAIAKGEIAVTKEFIGETKIEKNWIDQVQFEAWQATKSHSKREDGRSKYVIYMTEGEESVLMNALMSEDFAATLRKAYEAKKAE